MAQYELDKHKYEEKKEARIKLRGERIYVTVLGSDKSRPSNSKGTPIGENLSCYNKEVRIRTTFP